MRNNQGNLIDYERLSDVLHTMLVWMPGNIFYGRQNRLDDPGIQLDRPAVHIVGQSYFSMMENLYNSMNSFINNAAARTVANFQAIVNQLNVVDNHPQFFFEESQWVQDESTRKWLIRASTEHVETTTRFTRFHDEFRRRRFSREANEIDHLLECVADRLDWQVIHSASN